MGGEGGKAVEWKKKTAWIITPTVAPPAMQTRVLLNPRSIISTVYISRVCVCVWAISRVRYKDKINRGKGRERERKKEREREIGVRYSTRVSNVRFRAYTYIRCGVIEKRGNRWWPIELFATKYFIPTSALEVGVTVGRNIFPGGQNAGQLYSWLAAKAAGGGGRGKIVKRVTSNKPISFRHHSLSSSPSSPSFFLSRPCNVNSPSLSLPSQAIPLDHFSLPFPGWGTL